MSRPRTKPLDPRTVILLPSALEARVAALATEAQSTVQNYIVEILTEWIQEHRSGRTTARLDKDYTSRTGTDGDDCSACLEIGRIRGQLVWALEHVLNERLTYYDYQEAQRLLGQIREDCP